MKQLFYLLLAAVMTLPSCVSKQVALQTESQRDSLAQMVRTKDSLIETVFADINAIIILRRSKRKCADFSSGITVTDFSL